jgi:hypothetical protein
LPDDMHSQRHENQEPQPLANHHTYPRPQRPSARASCALFIDERPLTPRLRASE